MVTTRKAADQPGVVGGSGVAGGTEQPVPDVQADQLPTAPPIFPSLPPTMMFDGTQLMAMFQQFMEAQNHQAAQFRESQNQQATQFRATVVDALRTREPAAPALVAPPAPAVPRSGTAKEYQNLCPLDFWGDEGIVYADEWLENAERTLDGEYSG
ncbi:uncharacterized protein M6B38_169050 [Iris pallida]|uniref:Uncharacterized protein n=1 Tax=Iris pallida TaxID=29817 RepID=A0AAX6EVL2_IRIPA|nr:uncharacterized protein M6B38_169050 [Iris pallida]